MAKQKGPGGVIDSRRKLTGGERLLCGLGAGVSEAIFVVTPMETIKANIYKNKFILYLLPVGGQMIILI